MKIFLIYLFIAIVFGYPSDPTNENAITDTSDSKYRLVYQAKSWTDAKEACESLGTHLAVANSKPEFLEIQKIVRNMTYPQLQGADYKLIAWIGLSNLRDPNVWETVTGEALEDTGFGIFAGSERPAFGLYGADPAQPHCAGVDAINLGYRWWWCNYKLAYICESN